MNDLVQEFMIEAGFARIVIHPTSPDGQCISVDPEIKKKAQKFSELILNECKKIVDDQSSKKLTNHFGVK
jgi:hypothetical protein